MRRSQGGPGQRRAEFSMLNRMLVPLVGSVRPRDLALGEPDVAGRQRVPDRQGAATVRAASVLTEGSRPVTGHAALILRRAGGSARIRLSVAELMACSP